MDQLPQPTLIVIRAVPGSGKSFVATRLQEVLSADRVVLLDPDAIDYASEAYKAHAKACEAEGVEPALHAYRFLRAQAYEAIAEHKIIIWNQPFTNLEIFNKMIGRLRDRAAECQTKLPILVVEVEADRLLAKQRVAARMGVGGHGPSDETLQKRFNAYSSFAGHGYNVVTVQGEDSVVVSVQKIQRALETLKA